MEATDEFDPEFATYDEASEALSLAIESVWQTSGMQRELICWLGRASYALVTPKLDRRDAVALTHQIVSEFESQSAESGSTAVQLDLKAGVAFIANVPNNFDAERLIESAKRCQNAARTSNGTSVKSIEVY